jgi:hypothetical protein
MFQHHSINYFWSNFLTVFYIIEFFSEKGSAGFARFSVGTMEKRKELRVPDLLETVPIYLSVIVQWPAQICRPFGVHLHFPVLLTIKMHGCRNGSIVKPLWSMKCWRVFGEARFVVPFLQYPTACSEFHQASYKFFFTRTEWFLSWKKDQPNAFSKKPIYLEYQSCSYMFRRCRNAIFRDLGSFGWQHTDVDPLPTFTYDVACAQFYQDPLGSLKMALLRRRNT